MTTEKALSDARSPIDGYARKTGPSRAPAAAASAAPKANVRVWILPIGTPMRAAVSRSWNVARIAVPRRVFWMSSQASPISAAAVSTTKSRSGAMLSGPSVRGAVGNGCGIERATPLTRCCRSCSTPVRARLLLQEVRQRDLPVAHLHDEDRRLALAALLAGGPVLLELDRPVDAGDGHLPERLLDGLGLVPAGEL